MVRNGRTLCVFKVALVGFADKSDAGRKGRRLNSWTFNQDEEDCRWRGLKATVGIWF